MSSIWEQEADHRRSHRNKSGMAELSDHGFYILGRDEEDEPLEFPSPELFRPRDLASALPEPPRSFYTLENFIERFWDREQEYKQYEHIKPAYQGSHLSAFWHADNNPALLRVWQSRKQGRSTQ